MLVTGELKRYLGELREEVSRYSDSSIVDWSDQDCFTQVVLDRLEEAGEFDSAIICPYKDRGVQLNAYSYSDDYETVELFVTEYKDSDSVTTVSLSEIEATITRGLSVFRKAIHDLYKSLKPESGEYEFSKVLHENKDRIKTVTVVFLTDGLVKQKFNFKPVNIESSSVSVDVWDIDRIHKCTTSGLEREKIKVNFQDEFNELIPCVCNKESEKYSVYLAILKGEMLAKLYDIHGARLLERNVRGFLQAKGKVNKGIRDTLRVPEQSEMFLAYNNGISVTADAVETVKNDDGYLKIKSISDMQIVNGGQTTASIHAAYKNKNDISRVYLQMKLSVINPEADVDLIASNISNFANTQNKVQMADFSANDPFHRMIEELSRTIWAPSMNGSKSVNWFYERSRGQYDAELSRQTTPARKRVFKEIHPVFTKTDLAKYENSWDQFPYEVSEGAQKNFNKFTVRLAARGMFKPDQTYYENLVAKLILFKGIEKIVTEQHFGGYRANIVTYTMAYLSNKTERRLNLAQIWKNQGLSIALSNCIVRLCQEVQRVIVSPPNGANITEWTKKEDCWKKVKAIEFDLGEDLLVELVDVNYTSMNYRAGASGGTNQATEEQKAIISQVMEISSEKWFALAKWAGSVGGYERWLVGISVGVGKALKQGKTPSYKQSIYAMQLYNDAKNKGYVEE